MPTRFIVQTITTVWTKRSRGGHLAALRARVPKQRSLLPLEMLPSVIWHSLTYGEANEFAEPISESVLTTCDDPTFGCTNAEVEFHENSATLTYRHQTGAPARQFFDKNGIPIYSGHVVQVPLNAWGTLEYNNRHTHLYTGNWWYEHVVINVAVASAISENVFLVSQPVKRASQLAKLF